MLVLVSEQLVGQKFTHDTRENIEVDPLVDRLCPEPMLILKKVWIWITVPASGLFCTHMYCMTHRFQHLEPGFL